MPSVNRGIAIVVPWYEILDTLNSPSILNFEMQNKSILSFERAAAEQGKALKDRLQAFGLGIAPSDTIRQTALTGAFASGNITISGLAGAELPTGLLGTPLK
jgi:hypothetical protein